MSRHLGHHGLRTLVLPYPLEGLPTDVLVDIALDSYPRLLELIGVAA